MARYDVSDTEWRLIAPLLPNKPRGVARVDGPTDHQCDLLCFEDGLALARSTPSLRASTAIIAGQKLASGYGFFLAAQSPGSLHLIDASIIRAHQHAAGRPWPLSPAQHDRALLLQNQTLPPRCYALRQTR